MAAASAQAGARGFDGCTVLKPGVRLDVLRMVDARDDGPSAIEVHVHGSGGTADGFTISNDVEPAQ